MYSKMKSVYLSFGFSVFVCFVVGGQGISNYDIEKNVIAEDERRAAEIDKPKGDDQTKSDTKKRALFSIGTKHSSYPSSGYDSSGSGGSGYYGSGGYGSSGSGYSHGHHYSPSYGSSYGPPSAHGFSSVGGYGGYPSEHGGGHGIGGIGGHGIGGISGHGGGGGIGHGHSGLALKGLLIPLAGIALLGAAAALSTNPVLLQLGVVNGRRRKRSLRKEIYKNVYPSNPHVQPSA